MFLNTAMICLIGEIKATEFSLLLQKYYVHLAHFQTGVDFHFEYSISSHSSWLVETKKSAPFLLAENASIVLFPINLRYYPDGWAEP